MLPSDVTDFAMLPAQRFWQETVSLLDVIRPQSNQREHALLEKTSSYITMNLFNTCTAFTKDLRGFANATCRGSLFHFLYRSWKKRKLINLLGIWFAGQVLQVEWENCEQEVSNLTTLTCNQAETICPVHCIDWRKFTTYFEFLNIIAAVPSEHYSGCKESQFYSLPLVQAVDSMY